MEVKVNPKIAQFFVNIKYIIKEGRTVIVSIIALVGASWFAYVQLDKQYHEYEHYHRESTKDVWITGTRYDYDEKVKDSVLVQIWSDGEEIVDDELEIME